MGIREAPVETYLRREVKRCGGWHRKVNWQGRRGAPDDLVSFGFPRIALVECKAPGEEVDWNSSQGREITRLRADGWPVYVVSSHDDVDEVIEQIARGAG